MSRNTATRDSAVRARVSRSHMNCGMTRWKAEPLKCSGLPILPMPFSPEGGRRTCELPVRLRWLSRAARCHGCPPPRAGAEGAEVLGRLRRAVAIGRVSTTESTPARSRRRRRACARRARARGAPWAPRRRAAPSPRGCAARARRGCVSHERCPGQRQRGADRAPPRRGAREAHPAGWPPMVMSKKTACVVREARQRASPVAAVSQALQRDGNAARTDGVRHAGERRVGGSGREEGA